jgi:hypothetical protein
MIFLLQNRQGSVYLLRTRTEGRRVSPSIRVRGLFQFDVRHSLLAPMLVAFGKNLENFPRTGKVVSLSTLD